MNVTLQRLDQVEAPALAGTIRNAGIAGAGGAGFPTHAKWARLEAVDHLMVNHQESEPNYYIDKWLGREHADELATFFDALLDRAFETVVVAAKEKDRERWTRDLEAATDATVYGPSDLPLDASAESGVVFAYTDDKYQYGMESVLLRMVVAVVMGDDLPMDHGWIVQNTETLYNVYRTLEEGEPMTSKLVHVDGLVPEHRFLEVPVGTPASLLLSAAGADPDDLADDELLLDGGPGWCFEIERSSAEFGVRKRTNCVLVVDEKTAWEHQYGQDRVNLLEPYNWDGDHETEPATLDPGPERVHVPLITNPAFEGVVEPSRPLVEPGDAVEEGEMIATPAGDGVSNAHHASVAGTVAAVTDGRVTIETTETAAAGAPATIDRQVYWTWCVDCGEYIAAPDGAERVGGPTEVVCEDCR